MNKKNILFNIMIFINEIIKEEIDKEILKENN